MAIDIEEARRDIEATADLLERAMKALVERLLYAEQDAECVASARQMMAAALADARFDWAEAGRLAALPGFRVSERLASLKKELSDA